MFGSTFFFFFGPSVSPPPPPPPPAVIGRLITGARLWDYAGILAPCYTGEDLLVQVPGQTDADPTAWAARFTLIAGGGATVTVTSAITRGVAGAGPYTCVFGVPLTHAQTAGLPPGEAGFQLDRTDPGNEQVLSAGTVEILAPRVPLP